MKSMNARAAAVGLRTWPNSFGLPGPIPFIIRRNALNQFVVRAECPYDVMDQEKEDNHAGAS
jgi:hypothetical protein